MKKLLTLLISMMATVSYAYDFYADGICYTIISEIEETCKVAKGESNFNISLEIPAQVCYDNRQFSVIAIEEGAFDNFYNLESLTIPYSVSTIDLYAFRYCATLKEITVADGNTHYCSKEGVLFNNDCSTLIRFPCAKGGDYEVMNTVEKIENGAFFWCSGLTSVILSDSIKEIGAFSFFYCDSLIDVCIPDSVIEIGEGAFSDCGFLKTVKIGKAVREMGEGVFERCRSLLSVDIPNNIVDIKKLTFCSCFSLMSVSIPNSVKKIGERAFEGCILKSLSIPESVMEIADCAFYNCGFESLILPDSVTDIGDRAFAMCYALVSVAIPESVKCIGEYTFSDCRNLEEIIVDPNNNVYYSIDGVLFNKDSSTLIIYPPAKIGEYVIPDSIKIIDKCAFLGCELLTSVTLPESLIRIEYAAFSDCNSITSIIIPDSVTEIGDDAFNGCLNLTSITIGDSVMRIGERAFYRCQYVLTLSIGKSIKEIGSNAFNFGQLVLTFYSSKEPIEIKEDIFGGCELWALLNVPAEAVDVCQQIDPWKNFQYIGAYDFTEVDLINSDSKVMIKSRHDISGSAVSEDYRGIVIISFTDGTIRKIIQK